jgi:septal ring factor EnvC (AmiA/AmiB activator)
MILSQASPELREMLESLEQQLVALYEEKQQASADAAEMATIREAVASLEAQLIELYREKEELHSKA